MDRRIRAIEVIPGNVEIVHHVLVSIDEFANNSVITTADCMGPFGGLIYSYAPGSPPLMYPSNPTNSFGVVIPAQSSITLSMHYPEGSYGQLDSTKVRFYFYPQNTSIRPIYTEYLINEGLPPDPPFLLPPNQITQISSTFGPIMNDMSLMSIYPHMHLLGKDMECYAVTPTNDTLKDIIINNPETGETIFANYGRYGPYLQYNKEFFSLPKGEDPLNIGINRAIDILSQPKKRRKSNQSNSIKSIGVYEKLNSKVELFKGRFGFYIKCNNKNYSLPKSYTDPESMTLKDAITVIEKKIKS